MSSYEGEFEDDSPLVFLRLLERSKVLRGGKAENLRQEDFPEYDLRKVLEQGKKERLLDFYQDKTRLPEDVFTAWPLPRGRRLLSETITTTVHRQFVDVNGVRRDLRGTAGAFFAMDLDCLTDTVRLRMVRAMDGGEDYMVRRKFQCWLSDAWLYRGKEVLALAPDLDKDWRRARAVCILPPPKAKNAAN